MDLIQRYSDLAYSPSNGMRPFDPAGWIQPAFAPFFKRALDSVSEKTKSVVIIEVGSWLGLSTRVMANELSVRGMKDSCVIAVDTWLGSPEHVGDEKLISLYETFVSNVKHEKLEGFIHPFRISSTQAGHFFEQKKITGDIIYIDAGHEYESVKLDIDVFWRVLKPDGFMLFDDYAWPGVIKAVDEHVKKTGTELFISGALAMIQKAPHDKKGTEV